jgi:KUP system potassium uptake protein
VIGKRAASRGSAPHGSELHKASPSFLALTAVGVVFGDIGTSPLYTLSVTLAATGHAVPTASDVLGIVSLIL